MAWTACFVSSVPAQVEATAGHRPGKQRQPVVDDPVAEHGKHRGWRRRAKSGGDRHHRELNHASPPGVRGRALAMSAAP